MLSRRGCCSSMSRTSVVSSEMAPVPDEAGTIASFAAAAAAAAAAEDAEDEEDDAAEEDEAAAGPDGEEEEEGEGKSCL